MARPSSFASASDPDRKIRGGHVLRKVAPYLWPKGMPSYRVRVVASLAMLLLSKFIAVYTPFIYKAAVDTLK